MAHLKQRGERNPQAVCIVKTQWQRFEKTLTLPGVEGKSITPGHYTGVGFDIVQQIGPISVEIADIQLERGTQEDRNLGTRKFGLPPLDCGFDDLNDSRNTALLAKMRFIVYT